MCTYLGTVHDMQRVDMVLGPVGEPSPLGHCGLEGTCQSEGKWPLALAPWWAGICSGGAWKLSDKIDASRRGVCIPKVYGYADEGEWSVSRFS